jgi:hypothetical protein
MKSHRSTSSRKFHAAASKVGMTIGIDLGDVCSHCCTIDLGQFAESGADRSSPEAIQISP